MKYTIHNAEFVSWAQDADIWGLEPKFHAVLCDPPYGISFMGKEWDKSDIHGDFQSQVKLWGQALIPLLYPGAIVMMFSGTRMWHRLAIGMEDAGFKLWDTMMWLYGQGFPKGQNISKLIDKENGHERKIIGTKIGLPGYSLSEAQSGSTYQLSKHRDAVKECEITAPGSEISAPWDGYKTPQFKPAWEPVLCFKAPADEPYAKLAVKYGSGCLNVDAGRIDTGEGGGNRDGEESKDKRYTEEGSTNFAATPGPRGGDAKGRYPANLILDETSAALLDEQTGILTSGKSKPEYRKKAKNNVYGAYANDDMSINVIGDSGGASRFFYCSKASQKERNAGLEDKNVHPTVKPIDLNKWLAGLLLPPSSVQNRRILVPFSGSGSEMIGCLKAGWDEVIGVEMDKIYCDIAEKRLEYHSQETQPDKEE